MTKARSAIDVAKDISKKMREAAVIDESETYFYYVILGLRKLAPLAPFRGYRRENTDYAAKLIEWIEQGQVLLAEPVTGIPPGSIFVDAVSLGQPEGRHIQFGAILTQMREQCEWIVQNKIGVHGKSGYQQERAAIIARGLMEKYGLPLAYSSPTSAYRTTARLFFEGMTEETLDGGEDIERACKVVAQLPMMRSIEVFARL
jgi:hypothetical protein